MENKRIPVPLKNISRSTLSAEKVILLWNGYWGGYSSWKKVFKRLLAGQCEENRCRLETDQKKENEADLILFQHEYLSKILTQTGLPKNRKSSQIYLLFSMEPPLMMDEKYAENKFRNFFNWTMTYQTTADIFVPYGRISFRKRDEQIGYEISQEELNKRKSAIWIASNCNASSKRENFLNEFKKHMNLDIFGKCGPYKCGTKTAVPLVDTFETDPCNEQIKEYTFYMSMENSLCKDYVTEKLYRPLLLGLIPVVYGSADYEKFAPPNSYVNINDFKNAKDVAEYLWNIKNDVTLFNKYMKWKETYAIEIGSPYSPMICDLCKKLHEPIREHKTYRSILDFYDPEKECYESNL